MNITGSSNISTPSNITAATQSVMDVSFGAKTISTQVGKGFLPGMEIKIFRSDDTWMAGPIVSYNMATGVLVVDVVMVQGEGQSNDWKLFISTPVVPSVRMLHDLSTPVVPNVGQERWYPDRDIQLQKVYLTLASVAIIDIVIRINISGMQIETVEPIVIRSGMFVSGVVDLQRASVQGGQYVTIDVVSGSGGSILTTNLVYL